MKKILILLLVNLLGCLAKICGNNHSDITKIEKNEDFNLLNKCSYLNGSLIIEGLNNVNDFKQLSNLNNISGYLLIKNTNSVNNLEGLHNLKNVEGLNLYKNKSIYISNNKDLCYLNLVNWNNITIRDFYYDTLGDNCTSICSIECISGHCFGHGLELCQNCIPECKLDSKENSTLESKTKKKMKNDYFLFLVIGISLGLLLLCFLIFFIIIFCKMRKDDKDFKKQEKKKILNESEKKYIELCEYKNPIYEPKKNPIYNDSIKVHKKRLTKFNQELLEINDDNNLELDTFPRKNKIIKEENKDIYNKDKLIQKNKSDSKLELGITKPKRQQSFDNAVVKKHLTLLEELKSKLPQNNHEDNKVISDDKPIPKPRSRKLSNQNINICVTDL